MLRREKKKKKEILSDKIANLLTVAPTSDVEDDHVFGTKPKTVTREELDSDGDSAEEAALSNFRKQNASLLADLSGRYAGEVTSKKELGLDKDSDSDEDSIEIDSDDIVEDSEGGEAASDAEEGSDDDENAEKNGDVGSDDVADSENGEEIASDMEEEQSDEDDSELEGSQDGFNLSENDKGTNDFKHFKEKDNSEEIEKGKCVKNQLNLWENLLEMRINLQKCLIMANKMPLPETIRELKKEGGEEFNDALNKSKGSVASLMTRLMELQTILISQYPETKDLFKKGKALKKGEEEEKTDDPMDEEISSDSDSVSSEKVAEEEDKPKVNRKRKLADYSEELSNRFSTYTKYRNGVIQKWNDKTRVATNLKNQSAPTSVLSQIQFILGDSNKLIRRTQMRRTKYDIIGEKKVDQDEATNGEGPLPLCEDRRNVDEEYCTEIFDDDDFYHQLLRELIEHKSSDISDPIQLSRQWILLQQMRSKMKRKIDTRATKGRRIRYAVHSKLVNFIAPEVNHDWTDEMKNELYASLFGKQFEGNTEGVKNKKSNENGTLEITSR